MKVLDWTETADYYYESQVVSNTTDLWWSDDDSSKMIYFTIGMNQEQTEWEVNITCLSEIIVEFDNQKTFEDAENICKEYYLKNWVQADSSKEIIYQKESEK